MEMKKSDMVRQYVAQAQYKEALRIAKDFRLGITKRQADTMKRGYECMVHGRFYESLGYNLNDEIRKGVDMVKKLYGEVKNDAA